MKTREPLRHERFAETHRLIANPLVPILLGVVAIVLGSGIMVEAKKGSNPFPSILAALGVIAVFLLIGFAVRVRTRVTDEELDVGILPIYRRHVPLGSVTGVENTTYRPLRDYLGWGLRWSLRSGGPLAITMFGDRCVIVSTSDGRRLLVGSQRAADLAAALDQGVRKAA